jgi:hypothetical protein
MRKKYRYVQSWVDGDGKVHNYFRRRGYPRLRLPGFIGSPEFVLAHAAALNEPRSVPVSTLRGGTTNQQQPLIGVYLLMLKGKIVYVGSSLHMPRRIAEHQMNGRPFDRVFYIAAKANEREALERVLIRAIDPSQNRSGRTDRVQPVSNSVSNFQ